MKKKLLSLALVLALCLALAAPAMAEDAVGKASEPETFDDGLIIITNAIEQEETEEVIGSYYVKDTLTCVTPVSIKPASEDNDEFSYSVRPGRIPEGKELKDLGDGDELIYSQPEGDSATLTEPGAYYVWLLETNSNGGGGFNGYLLFVQADNESSATDPSETEPGAKPVFTDVKEGDWFYEAVQWAVEKEITNGTGKDTFSPALTCTEAHILTFLWRANGCPEPETAPDSDAYYAKAAKWAVEKGITDEFNADAPCTRAMAVEYLWRLAGSPESATEAGFTDVEAGTELAGAVAWALEKEITNGTGRNTFSPDDTCTRGHIVTFLYRNFAK